MFIIEVKVGGVLVPNDLIGQNIRNTCQFNGVQFNTKQDQTRRKASWEFLFEDWEVESVSQQHQLSLLDDSTHCVVVLYGGSSSVTSSEGSIHIQPFVYISLPPSLLWASCGWRVSLFITFIRYVNDTITLGMKLVGPTRLQQVSLLLELHLSSDFLSSSTGFVL